MMESSARISRIYIYPLTLRGSDISSNPYIGNLITGLELSFDVVNKNDPSQNGIIQIFKYLSKADIFFFNWIENLPDKKGGKIQVFLLFAIFFLIKLFKKKIIWTMHNKISHSKKNYFLKKIIFKMLLRCSNFVLTHSKEGIKYAKSLSNHNNTMHYLPHPIAIKQTEISIDNKDYDFLIWGAMIPYKGIHAFLEFLIESKIEHNYSILIIGKFSSNEYFDKIQNLAGKNVRIENRFASIDELQLLVNKSKFVLFTYNNNSVLSSGALMDTLGFNANIIGPNTGAFADLFENGIIHTYHSFNEIITIYDNNKSTTIDYKKRTEFIEQNDWKSFSKNLNNLIITCEN